MTAEPDETNRTPSTAQRVGKAMGRAAGSAARGARETIRKNQTANRIYRTGVGVVGGSTVALGIVLIPLPGPGSLIAIGGLAVLATEFEGAKKASAQANTAARKGVAFAKEQRAKRQAKKAAKASPAA